MRFRLMNEKTEFKEMCASQPNRLQSEHSTHRNIN